jgi:hypothetical protein
MTALKIDGPKMGKCYQLEEKAPPCVPNEIIPLSMVWAARARCNAKAVYERRQPIIDESDS